MVMATADPVCCPEQISFMWRSGMLPSGGVFHFKVYMTALALRRRERCTLVLTYFSLEVVNIISIHSTFAEARSVASSKRAWNSVRVGGSHVASQPSWHCHRQPFCLQNASLLHYCDMSQWKQTEVLPSRCIKLRVQDFWILWHSL